MMETTFAFHSGAGGGDEEPRTLRPHQTTNHLAKGPGECRGYGRGRRRSTTAGGGDGAGGTLRLWRRRARHQGAATLERYRREGGGEGVVRTDRSDPALPAPAVELEGDWGSGGGERILLGSSSGSHHEARGGVQVALTKCAVGLGAFL